MTATAPSPVTNVDPTPRRRTDLRARGRRTAIALALAASALAFPIVGPGIDDGPNAYAEPTVSASPVVSGPLRYRDSVFTDVDVARNVVYGQAPDAPDGGVDLLADVYQPVGDVDPLRPVIVWMHGAGPASNDKAHVVDAYIASSFARHGTVVMSINYRFKANGLNRPVDDAHQALAGLRANATTYRVDGSRIAIGGGSAGGIAALDTVYRDDIEAGAPIPEHRVRAALSISGAGPMGVAQAGEAPVMMEHGTTDNVVSYAGAQAFCDETNVNGVDCMLRGYPAGHADLFAFAAEIEPMLAEWFYDVLDLASLPAATPAQTPVSAPASSRLNYDLGTDPRPRD